MGGRRMGGCRRPLGKGRDYGRRRGRRRVRACSVEKGARSEVVSLRVASSRSHEVISGCGWLKLYSCVQWYPHSSYREPFDKARRIHVARTEEPLR